MVERTPQPKSPALVHVPSGYASAENSYNGITTTAICCQVSSAILSLIHPAAFRFPSRYSCRSFSYIDTVSPIMRNGPDNTYEGPAGAFTNPMPTTITGRSSNTISLTVVAAPITMCDQPIWVAFQTKVLSLFTTSTSGTSSPGPTTTGNGPSPNPPVLTNDSAFPLAPTQAWGLPSRSWRCYFFASLYISSDDTSAKPPPAGNRPCIAVGGGAKIVGVE